MPKKNSKKSAQPSSSQAAYEWDFEALLNQTLPASSSSNAGGQTSCYSPMPPAPPLLQNPYSHSALSQCQPHFDQAAWMQFQDQHQQRQEYVWQQFLLSQQQQPQQQTKPQVVEEDEDDEDGGDDGDDDEETQAGGTSVASADDEIQCIPVKPKRLTKKGKEMAEKAMWVMDDAVLLAEAWTHASEDSVVGNSQTEAMFWGKVVRWFNQNTKEGHRNKSQLQGKWNKIKKQCKEFGGILKKYLEHQRQSGADEKQLYDAAHAQYKQTYGGRFTYEPCYHVLKDTPKFWSDHSAAKQSAPSYVDLGDDGPSFAPTPNSGQDKTGDQLFGDDQIRKPRGRNVSRRMSSSDDVSSSRGASSGSDATLTKLDKMLKLQEEAVKKIDAQWEKAEEERKRKEEHRLELKVMEAIRVLQQPIPTGVPEEELVMIRASRKALMDKYGKYFGSI